jgi:hypothetical protein
LADGKGGDEAGGVGRCKPFFFVNRESIRSHFGPRSEIQVINADFF